MNGGVGIPVRRKELHISSRSDAAPQIVKSGHDGSTLHDLNEFSNWEKGPTAVPSAHSIELDDPDDLSALTALLQKSYGKEPVEQGAAEALSQQLAWCDILIPHIAARVAREAEGMERDGLIKRGPTGNFRRCTDRDGKERKGPWERKADKSKARTEKLGKELRLKNRTHGHTLGTGGFLTPDKHAVNYVVSSAGSLGKEIAYGAGDATAPGMGDVVSLLTIPVHAMFIDNVRNTRQAINERAGMGVVLGLQDVQDCLEILKRGVEPSPALMARWLSFWNDVVA